MVLLRRRVEGPRKTSVEPAQLKQTSIRHTGGDSSLFNVRLTRSISQLLPSILGNRYNAAALIHAGTKLKEKAMWTKCTLQKFQASSWSTIDSRLGQVWSGKCLYIEQLSAEYEPYLSPDWYRLMTISRRTVTTPCETKGILVTVCQYATAVFCTYFYLAI